MQNYLKFFSMLYVFDGDKLLKLQVAKNWQESFRIALQHTNIVLYICLLNKKYKFEKV